MSKEIFESKRNNNDQIVKKKVLKKTEYLFGIPASVFKGMEYEEALRLKISSANNLLDVLQDVHYMERDYDRINDILSAIEHTSQQIKELYE